MPNLLFGQSPRVTINSSNITRTGTTVTIDFQVSGVLSWQQLIQINLDLGSSTVTKSAFYRSSSTSDKIIIKDNSNTTRVIGKNDYFGYSSSSSDQNEIRKINIHIRDHAFLKHTKEYTSFYYCPAPFYYGYYRSDQTFANLNTGTAANGNWQIIFTGVESHVSINSAQLVFGRAIVPYDISISKPNQSCATAQCLQTGDIIIGTNDGYPSNQTSAPNNTIDGCKWNFSKDRMAWFKFYASSTTAEFSISGLNNKMQSIVIYNTAGNCSPQNFKLAGTGNTGCPTYYDGSRYDSEKYYYCNPNDNQYSCNSQYDNACTYEGGGTGRLYNHGYKLTGLTPGNLYYLVIDGVNATNTSNFYLEMLSGADNIDLGGGKQGGCGRSGPLPVLLNSFFGNNLEMVNEIQWQTDAEINNAFFILEKSEDGENWFFLSRINGAGNSNTPINYSYTDYIPFETTYYRLIQQDFSGKLEYFGPISISSKKTEDYNIVYPNPVVDVLNFPVGTKFTLNDIQGKFVLIQNSNSASSINLSNLNSGLYFIKFKNGETQKIIKQ